jgi:hypothetical protein
MNTFDALGTVNVDSVVSVGSLGSWGTGGLYRKEFDNMTLSHAI